MATSVRITYKTLSGDWVEYQFTRVSCVKLQETGDGNPWYSLIGVRKDSSPNEEVNRVLDIRDETKIDGNVPRGPNGRSEAENRLRNAAQQLN